MKTFTITLTEEQAAKFNTLKATREGKSDQELIDQIVHRGMYDIAYRTKRNKQEWALKQEFKQWKADRD
jgi:hypothetical protein